MDATSLETSNGEAVATSVRVVGAAPEKKRWPRADALAVAKELCVALKPACAQMIVAGSLRRRKPDVGDVEILFVPRMEVRPVDMFESKPFSLADEVIEWLLATGRLAKRPSTLGVFAWGAKNKLALHVSGMPVDLFTATPENWWNYVVCRTGPAESNTRIATLAQQRGYKWNPYGQGFTRLSDGEIIPMGSEAEVFAFVGLEYREPVDRT